MSVATESRATPADAKERADSPVRHATTDPAAAREVPAGEPRPLERVPRPGPDESIVDLAGLSAGGLSARSAEWRVDGGEVLLTGAGPFVDLSGRAGFRSDGTLDGTVAMRAAVRLLGLQVAQAEWTVSGWTPDMPLRSPAVQLRGTTLAVDLAGIDAEVAVSTTEGLASTRTGTALTVSLPDGALPGGLPLEPRVVELFRGLRGWDVSGLRAHAHSAVEQAPAFVTDRDLFFAPGRYGADSPETAALLDAAVRAALAGLVGPVAPTPVAPPPGPAPDAETPRPAETSPVPATVPPVPAVEEARAEVPAAAGAAPAEATSAEGAAAAQTAAPPEAGAAGAEAEAGAEAPTPVAPAVELLMPPAPTAPGPATQSRIGAVGGGAGRAARAARDLPPAQDSVAEARGAVTEPVAETAARASEGLAAALGERPAPSPEIVALCERIRTAIREHRPVDENALLRTDPTREAQAAGATVSGSVEGQVNDVGSSYDAMGNPPTGTPALTPTPVTTPPETSPGMSVDAASAAPDPIPPENLSLDADVAATDERITAAGVDTRVTQAIPDSPFSEVREARGELGAVAQQTPAELAAQQTQAIETAQASMATLQQQATEALLAARTGTVTGVSGRQAGMVSSEQQTREAVGRRAQGLFDSAQTRVDSLLQPLGRTAMTRWETGLARISQEFRDSLDAVQRWIDKRHAGVDGFFVGLGDAVFGLPDWVIREYDRAERQFGDDVCALLLDISTEVNGVVAAAQAIIAQARDDIDAAFTAMEAEFPEWAAQERARFSGLLDGLSARATQAQTSFVQDVSRAATQAVTEAQAAVEERRATARGLVGRIAAAIDAFIDDPVTAIINGLLSLVGIPPAMFWALVARIQQVMRDIADDPERFINNLTAGVKQGFEQFFDRFGTHVLRGFWTWLFSGLETPIPMPRDFSARSLFSFALQLMGITWPRVREILVRHVGEQNVAIVEAAWQLISVLIERGPDGIVEMIKEQLTPEVIVQTILDAAVEFLVETIIQQVVVRVIGMLNPVGAIAQAIDLIYQVCSWIFRNAARIFRFVEAVVNGMADVIAGNITGLANAVERALAMLIPPVIDFLAGLLHLGGLPGRVAEVITRLQEQVLRIMDRVIGFLAERGRALLARLGLGRDEEEPGQHNGDAELGTTVRFSAAGERHRLWVALAGEDATLMVASVPQPIADKIAEWRGLVASGQPADDAARAEALTTLGNLESVADQANTEGDRLARLFLEANRDPNDTNEPPSDDALESRERAIAGMLDRLYTLFGQRDEAEIVNDIARELPGRHGQARAETITRLWATRYSGPPKYLPVGATVPVGIWDTNALATAAIPTALRVLGRSETHLALVPYFTSGVERRGGAAAQAFGDYALVSGSAPHGVRAQFEQALGEAYASEMASHPPANLDPIDVDLRESITTTAFVRTTEPYGSFTIREQPDPPLVQGVRAVSGVTTFFRQIAQTGQAGGYTAARLQWAWTHPPSKTWLNEQFRLPGRHEWIPTDLLPQLLRAALDAGANAVALARAVKWIDFQHALRSQTSHVLWHFTPEPAGHVGSFSSDQSGRHSMGTGQSHDFHNWLRQIYRTNQSAGPYEFSIAVMTDINAWVWTGDLSRVPSAHHDDLITAWYNLEGVGRVQGMTIRDLGDLQWGNYHTIIRDFERALDAVQGW